VGLQPDHAALDRFAEDTNGAKRLEKLRKDGQYVEMHENRIVTRAPLTASTTPVPPSQLLRWQNVLFRLFLMAQQL
jgi:hypothetical protein